MTVTSWPFFASHSAISPVYFPVAVSSGEKFSEQNNIRIVICCNDPDSIIDCLLPQIQNNFP